MHFSLLFLATALVYGAPLEERKAPLGYNYQFSVSDTSGYASPFYITDAGPVYGRNYQIRPAGEGKYITTVDNSSPVIQAQLRGGKLQLVDYQYQGPSKPLPGFSAGLIKSGFIAKTNTTSYELVWSKKPLLGEEGSAGFGLFNPLDDGIYGMVGEAPASFSEKTFAWALCPGAGSAYQQLIFLQSPRSITVPKGCTGTTPTATLAPPYDISP